MMDKWRDIDKSVNRWMDGQTGPCTLNLPRPLTTTSDGRARRVTHTSDVGLPVATLPPMVWSEKKREKKLTRTIRDVPFPAKIEYF